MCVYTTAVNLHISSDTSSVAFAVSNISYTTTLS